MQIAVDCRFLTSTNYTEYSHFTVNVILPTARKYTDCNFIFFIDKSLEATSFPENVTRVTTPSPKNFLTYKWWFDIQLPFLLKKHKATVFVGSYGLIS